MKRWIVKFTDIFIISIIAASVIICVHEWKGICGELERISSSIGANFEGIEIEITAYSPSPNITMGDPFVMASGKRATPEDLEQLRFVAMSRDLIKKYGLEYGDTIWIGFTVEDTMNKRIENTVDLFMRNLDLARKFGRQERQIIIRRNR